MTDIELGIDVDLSALDAITEEAPQGDTFRTFTDAVIGLVGQPTSDGRMLAASIELSFRSFPLPLMWCKQSKQGHSDSYTVGVIEAAELRDTEIVASGYLLNTAEADEAANELAHGVSSPSVDLASAEWEFTDINGVAVSGDSDPLDAYMTFTKAELIGTTLVATAAFGDTRLSLNEGREAREVALVAAAAFQPKVYDHRLFENPNLPGPTLPTMGADGRIYGHLAVFGQCHRSVQTECVMVPRSPSDYTHFHTSPALRLDNGTRLPVGRLTVGTGHADPRLGAAPAAAHYDNTGACFALVRVGEDAHGVWFSGVAAPWATPEQVEQGVSSPLSGDWRNFGQGLDLVAALSVNTPGFSARGRDDDQGQPLALVASVGPVVKPGPITGTTKAEMREIVREAIRAEQERRDHIITTMATMIRAEKTVGKPPTPRDRIAALLNRGE
jgi:hypothetical protein